MTDLPYTRYQRYGIEEAKEEDTGMESRCKLLIEEGVAHRR